MSNTFRAYEKIHHIGKDEVQGILDIEVYLQEKIDGANVSIWLEDGGVKCGSRTRDLVLAGDDFNGFVSYVKAHNGINMALQSLKGCRLYGEWLVRHTISYNETAYKQFYLFDIYDERTNEYVSQEYVRKCAEDFGINYAPIIHKGFFTVQDLDEIAGISTLGSKGEGIVIKPAVPFINQFGDNVYAKYVTSEFKENNAVVFGGNNKSSECYNEQYIVNKYMTLARIQKIMHKLEPTLCEHEKLSMKHIPQIMGMAYHDLITEEMWDILKSIKKIDFVALKRICDKKAKVIYQDILSGLLSVAYFKEDVSKMSE